MTSAPTADPQVWAYLPEVPRRGAGGQLLSGLNYSVKDLFGVDGWPLRASTRAPLPAVPESPLVGQLQALGASLVGKTQLHEIALGITGANAFGGTPNPLDPARVTGGSSSGAAASVAGGSVWGSRVDFALGTDTGGSIRVPAAWCGVVGYKPSKGHPAWPTDGVLALSATCDHVGPLARDLGTIARVQRALTSRLRVGGEPCPAVDWAGVRVGLWRPQGWLAPAALDALDQMVSRARRRGALIEEVTLPDMRAAYGDIVQSEAAQVHAAALALAEPGFGAGTLALLRRGAGLSQEEVNAARRQRDEYRALLDELWGRHEVLLAPAVPDVAPLLGQDELALPGGPVTLREAVLRLSVPFSLLGVPTLALPLPTPDGLSVGVQLAAPHLHDQRLIGLGLTLRGEA